MNDVCVAGRGKLGQALIAGLNARPFDENLDECTVRAIIHAGSGREMPQILNFCEKYQKPLIQAASGIKPPSHLPLVYIEAPNLAIPIWNFVKAIGPFVRAFGNAKISLTESHQAKKTTQAATARLIAKELDIEEISSIRDPKEQVSRFRVEAKALDSHAIHEVSLSVGGVQIRVEVRIEGLLPYVEGAKAILKLDLASLRGGLYTLSELATLSERADNITTTH